MGNGQWAMGNGQWAMGNGQRAMGKRQWAMGNGHGDHVSSTRGTTEQQQRLWWRRIDDGAGGPWYNEDRACPEIQKGPRPNKEVAEWQSTKQCGKQQMCQPNENR